MYTPGKTNSLLVLSTKGIHEWTADVPAQWKPETIQEICLVAYITSKDAKFTGYQEVTYRGNEEIYRKNVMEDQLKIHVIEARTGLLLGEFIVWERWRKMKAELERFVKGEVNRCRLAKKIRKNPEIMYNPRSESLKNPISHWRIRRAVVKKLEDQKLLSDIALNDKNENVRKEAIGKLKTSPPKILK